MADVVMDEVPADSDGKGSFQKRIRVKGIHFLWWKNNS
jgi:hypothetical protein